MSAPAGRLRAVAASPIALVVVVTVPFVVAAVRLATQRWYPVLDLAMTEFRVRDVGGVHTPLIGLPGRIGSFPDQGSHPGPLSFYLVAPFYRLLGSHSWAMLVGACAVGAASVTGCILISRRLGGRWLQACVALVLLFIVQGYGLGVLSQPWNPYLPLMPWCLVLLSAWAVLSGDSAVLWVAAVAGSVCAQTHLPYVGLAGGVVSVCIAVVVWRWLSQDRHSAARRREGRQLAIGVGAGFVCWLPVLIDQLAGSQNLSMIVDYFRHPPEQAIGLVAGARLLLRHLDLTRLLGGAVSGSGSFAEASSRSAGSIVPGVMLLLAWATAAGIAIAVLRHRRLSALHALIGICLLLQWMSMGRIFGKVWYYLTLWAWSVTALMAAATVWTLVEVVRRRAGRGPSRPEQRVVVGVLAVVGVLCWSTLVVAAGRVRVPEPGLSRSLGAVVDPTAQALRDGVGAADGIRGRYTVLWNDAYFFGSQGYGLVSELERRGFDVGAPNTWRVPITEQRVIEIADATAVVQFATGSYLQQWRAEPSAVEVATFEPRSPEELAEYERLRAELIDGLLGLQIDDASKDNLVEAVDRNLFGVQLDPAVPPTLQQLVNRMLELGQETAVFIVPVEFYDPVG